jgi:hypothetical protein
VPTRFRTTGAVSGRGTYFKQGRGSFARRQMRMGDGTWFVVGSSAPASAISRVQTVGTRTNNAATPITFTIPAGGVAAGRLLVIRGVTDADTANASGMTVTDSRGNSYTVVSYTANAGDVMNVVTAYAILTTALQAGDTITIASTAFVHFAFEVTEFSGVATTSPRDGTSATNRNGFGTAWSSGSLAITNTDDLLLLVVGNGGGATSVQGTGGFTEESDLNDAGMGRNFTTAWRTASAAGSYSASGTYSTNTSGNSLLIAFKAAGGDTTAPVTVFVSGSRSKVSTVTGFTTDTVLWSVDEDCQAWQIREVANASDGIDIAGQTVASGGAISAGAQQSTDIVSSSLSTGDGSKLLKIFAQDLAGNWSA